MIALPAIAGLISAAVSARRFLNRNAAVALAVASVGVVVVGAAAGGIAWLRHDAAAVATARERAEAELRRLRAENAIWKSSVARRTRILEMRAISIEAQEHEIAILSKQLKDARDATKVDPRRPVIPADDPWLRHGAAGTPTGDRPGPRR